ncbi:MAG TPA: CehA/McbA family metallohydrolase [Polyangiaceae bacterium]
MREAPRSGPVSIGLFSAFFALGIASAATRHPHADRSAVVRASGTGRLVGAKTSYAIQPEQGRVTMQTTDGKLDLAFDVAVLVDGEARPVSLDHLEPAGKKELVGDLPIELDGGTLQATLAFVAQGDGLAIELRTTDPRAAAHGLAVHVTMPSDGKPFFVSGVGEIADSARRKGMAALVIDDTRPYAFVSTRGPIEAEVGFDEEDNEPTGIRRTVDGPPIADGASATDVIVTTGAPSAIWSDLYARAHVPVERLFGEVIEQVADAKKGEKEIAHARVVGLDQDGNPQVLAFADATGAFDVVAPTNVTRWYAALDEARTSAPIRFVPGTKYALKLDVSPSGDLRTKIVDGDTKQAVTARLVVHGIEGTLDPSFGPDYRASGAGPIVDALRGEVDTPLSPGKYRVCATKGIEWSVDCREITIEGGRGFALQLELRHVIPTPTMLDCDLHVHARPSFDTLVTSEDRVLSLVAAGIEFAVPSEHNLVGDYGPALAELDMNHDLATVRGVEVTTYSPRFGHFGVFPYPGNKPVPPYRHSNMGAVIAAGRRGDSTRVVQLNHPRMGKGIGYFTDVGYDPDAAVVPRRIRLDFDTIEIYNGYEIATPEKTKQVLDDFYSLLNRGRKIGATGSSDSHHIQYQWAGYPRTVVDLGKPVASDTVDPLAVVAAIKAGHAVVTSGPVIEVEANGAHPGEETTSPDGKVTAHVRVLAAPWVDVTSVELVVDGESVKTFDVASRPTKTGPELGSADEVQKRAVRFEADVPITAGAGLGRIGKSWFCIVARGTRKLDDVLPFMPVTPFALANPIWISRGGTTPDKPAP